MYNSSIAVLKGIKATFAQMLQVKPDSIFSPFIFRTNTVSNKEQFWIPHFMPAIKEWIDNIDYSESTDDYLEVLTKPWQNGFVVDRFTLSDSREYLGGGVEAWIKTLVNTYADFPDELCEALLEANSTAFDSTAFFATSRPNIDTGNNSIDNLYTGTLSSAYTTSTFSADFAGAEQALLGFRDKNDRPMNKGAVFTAFVPPHLKNIAETILSEKGTTYYDAGTSVLKQNIYSGKAKIVINYEQASSNNDWYLINEKAAFPPFVITDNKGPQWNVKDEPDQKDIKYFFTFRMGYNFLSPFGIVKINN